MRALRFVTGLALAATLAGCSSDSDNGKEDVQGRVEPNASGPVTPEVLRGGFGQIDQYVQAIVVVKNSDEASVGEFVTVSVNFKDASGQLVATETQTESFSWKDQELVLPVWLDLSEQPKVDVASIDPAVTISDHGSAADSADPISPVSPVEAASIAKNEYGSPAAKFTLTNPGSEALEDLRVGVVCENATGDIIGGASDYPDLIPAGGEILANVDVTVSEMPARCTAYPNYGDF